jgi:hypothetical protein
MISSSPLSHAIFGGWILETCMTLDVQEHCSTYSTISYSTIFERPIGLKNKPIGAEHNSDKRLSIITFFTITVWSRVGRFLLFYILNKSHSNMCSTPCNSEENKKLNWVNWSSQQRSCFSGSCTIKESKFFLLTKIWGLWISKDPEFNINFKNINFPNVRKMFDPYIKHAPENVVTPPIEVSS